MAESSHTRAQAPTRDAMRGTVFDSFRRLQEQAHRQASINHEAAQETHFTLSQSSDGQGLGVTASNKPSSANITIRDRPNMVYSIATLLELGEGTPDSTAMLRIKPEAIAENLFQYMGMNRSVRPPPRSRGLTDISNFSRRSMIASGETNESVAYARFPTQPSRQPRSPPDNSFLQQHEGFVRFLKQHASPPHQRVTAGGRIVPTGPLSPPPMFDYASLNGLVQGQQVKIPMPIGSRSVLPSNFSSNNRASSMLDNQTQSMFPGVYPNQEGNLLGPQTLSSGMAAGATNYGSTTFAPQMFMNPTLHSPVLPSGVTALGTFQDGSALASYHGVCYRCYWTGIGMVMEPLQTAPSVPTLNTPAAAYPQTPPGKDFFSVTSAPVARQPASQPSNKASLRPAAQPSPRLDLRSAPQTSVPQTTSRTPSPPYKVTLGRFTNEEWAHYPAEDKLRGKLFNVNKMLAKFHYKIDDWEKAYLVTQRKLLTEAIDRFRASRNPMKSTMPIVTKSQTSSRSALEQLDPPDHYSSAAGQTKQVVSDHKSKLSSTLHKTHLSPDAPPFVPSGMQDSFPGSLTLGRMPKEAGTPMRSEAPGVIDTPPGNNTTDETFDGSSASGTEGIEDHSYLPRDERDPAMRIIRPDDIKYAAKYASEDDPAAKKYCSTLPEFQEAVRQVREHARQWGCAGGSSRDPAYDAEQDIWWAICDKDPVPLPPAIPDHIARPRAWNWNDSAFNYNPSEAVGPEKLIKEALPASHALFRNTKDMASDSKVNGQPPEAFTFEEQGDFRVQIRDTWFDPSQHRHKFPPNTQFLRTGIKPLDRLVASNSTRPGPATGLPTAKQVSDLEEMPYYPPRYDDLQTDVFLADMRHEHGFERPGEAPFRDWQDEGGVLFSKILEDEKHEEPEHVLAPRVKIPSLRGEKSQYGPSYQSVYANYEDHGRWEAARRRSETAQAVHKLEAASVAPLDREHNMSPPNIYSAGFLGRMLKDPRYSFNFSYPNGTPMPAVMAYERAGKKARRDWSEDHHHKCLAEIDELQRLADKENAESCHKATTSISSNITLPVPAPSAHKTAPSLASSGYQARGYLPPYNGAGKAHTSAIYQQQPQQFQTRQPRVNLPRSSSYGQRRRSDDSQNQHSPYNNMPQLRINTRQMPSPFGYDGSEDPPPQINNADGAGKAKEDDRSSFDTKGVTMANFDQHRPEHDNEWHRGAVNDFFHAIHEKEVQKMMSHQRKNTKTAP